MAFVPHTEPPVYIEYVFRGDHYNYDDANDTAAERRPITAREAWVGLLDVPSVAPPQAPWPGGPIVDSIRGVSGVPLGQVPGNPFRFSYEFSSPPPAPPFDHFLNMVPANYAEFAFKPRLRDSKLAEVPYDPGVWVADGLLGVVEFKYKTPQELGFTPPFTIDYWRYVGSFGGSGELANDGGGAEVYEAGTVDPSLLRTLVADPAPAALGLAVTQDATTIRFGNTMTGVNLEAAGPTTAQVFAQKSAGSLEFRALKAGLGVTLSETATGITVNATGAGGISGLANEGVGADVFDTLMGSTAVLRRINGTANGLTVTQNATDITVDNTLSGQNVGTGVGVFRDKTADRLNLRSVQAGAGVSVALVADDVVVTNTDTGSAVTLTTAGGVETLVSDGVGPALATKGLTAGAGVALSSDAVSVTVANTDPGSAVTLTSAGGAETLVNDGAGPALATKGLTAGAGITLTGAATSISITNNDPGSAVTLTSAGGAETLVNDGTGPALATKGLTAGAGITLTGAATSISIANNDPGSAVTLTNAGVTSLVNDGAGPALATKGLIAGTGVSFSTTATDVTVTNTDLGSSVTLSNAGTTSLVNDGAGPTLATKGLVAGTGVSFSATATDITITNTDLGSAVSLASAGGTETLVNDGTGPALATKGLTAGTGITLSSNATSVTVTNNDPGSAVSLTSAGGTETLVNDGTGPALATKGLTAGTGITLSSNATSVTVTNSDPGSSVSLTNAGVTSLVNAGAGPALATKGLIAGTGVSFSTNATDVTITNSDPASGVTLASAGGTETLVNDGTGPALATKGLTAGTGITLSSNATSVTITASAGFVSSVSSPVVDSDIVVWNGTGGTSVKTSAVPVSSLLSKTLGGTMSADIDMNQNDLLNVASITPGSTGAVIFGTTASAATNCVAVGPNTSAGGTTSVAIGSSVGAAGSGAVAVGPGANASAAGCVAISSAAATNTGAVAVGRSTNASVAGAICLGDTATASGTDGMALGHSATTNSTNGIAIGPSASATASGAISLGASAANATANSFLFGTSSVANIRPNNTGTCDLGTSGAKFKDVNLSGNVAAATANLTGAATAASMTFSTTSGIIGTTSNNNAAALSVGESITSSASAVASATNAVTNITSISLTAGDWNVYGSFGAPGDAAAGVVSLAKGGHSTSSATFSGTLGTYTRAPYSTAAGAEFHLPVPEFRYSLNATTTVFLVGQITYTGTNTLNGYIGARRMR